MVCQCSSITSKQKIISVTILGSFQSSSSSLQHSKISVANNRNSKSRIKFRRDLNSIQEKVFDSKIRWGGTCDWLYGNEYRARELRRGCVVGQFKRVFIFWKYIYAYSYGNPTARRYHSSDLTKVPGERT